MSKLLFVADTENIYDASVYTLGPNQVRLVFSNTEVKPADAVLLSGFNVINEYNHSIIEASYTETKRREHSKNAYADVFRSSDKNQLNLSSVFK